MRYKITIFIGLIFLLYGCDNKTLEQSPPKITSIQWNDKSVEFSWEFSSNDKENGVKKYIIRYGKVVANETKSIVLPADVKTHKIENLTPGVMYKISISVVFADFVWNDANILQGTPGLPTLKEVNFSISEFKNVEGEKIKVLNIELENLPDDIVQILVLYKQEGAELPQTRVGIEKKNKQFDSNWPDKSNGWSANLKNDENSNVKADKMSGADKKWIFETRIKNDKDLWSTIDIKEVTFS